jgi:hypothetical protein
MNGRYSKKRLIIMGVFWIAVGAFFTGGSLLAGVGADPNCPAAPDPCDYPAENYDGGIVLGTPSLQGDQLVFFNPNTASSVDGYSGFENTYTQGGQRNVGSTDTLPPGAESPSIDVASIGFNVDTLNQGLFLYKTWKTTEDRDFPTQTEVDNRNYQNAYVWIQGDKATLGGPSGEVNGVNCKQRDSDNELNPNHCDLVAELSEVAFNNLTLDADVFVGDTPLGIGSGEYSVSGSQLSGIDGDPQNSYWVIEPEDDTCSVGLDVIEFTGLISIELRSFCLSFVDATFADQEASNIQVLGITVGTVTDFTINDLELQNLVVKGPSYFAEKPSGSAAQGANSQDLNKNLIIGEKNRDPALDNPGFYAEIRWGKGHDRALFPESNPDLRGDTSRFGGPAPIDSDLQGDSTRYSGLALPYPCEGNPTGIGYQNCNRNTDNQGSPEPGPYDDINRP